MKPASHFIKLIGIVFLLVILGAIFYFFYKKAGLFQSPAGLQIRSQAPATVYLNNKNVGDTPYINNNLKPTLYHIRLQPKDSHLQSYETSLHLTPKLTTVINRFLLFPGGYSLHFQPAPKKQAFLTVITNPDSVKVNFDSQPLGLSPLVKKALAPGDHSLVLSHIGYKDLSLHFRLITGYELIVKAELTPLTLIFQHTASATTSATPSAQKQSSSSATSSASRLTPPYVVIQQTGTGWLRVRQKPSTSSPELGKVDVGSKLKFIKSNESGWYQIIFHNQKAWISGKYAKIYR